MRTLVIALAAYTAAVGVVCAALYASGSSWRSSPVGINVLAVTVGIAALIIALLSMLTWVVPLWVFAVIFAELGTALTQRAWLVWKAQRKERV